MTKEPDPFGFLDPPRKMPPTKPCAECGGPMHAHQRVRHGVCSPPMPCCGTPSDLVPDHAAHHKAHQEPTRR